MTQRAAYLKPMMYVLNANKVKCRSMFEQRSVRNRVLELLLTPEDGHRAREENNGWTQNYGSKGLQGCEIRIIKMATITVLHDPTWVRFDIPMEVNMNNTVLLEVTLCSLVYTTTSVYNHQPSRSHIPEDGFPVIFVYSDFNCSHENPQTYFRKLRQLRMLQGWRNEWQVDKGGVVVRSLCEGLCVAERTLQRQSAHHSSDLWITMLRRALQTAGILQKLESRRMV
jgi:hypothetical protein